MKESIKRLKEDDKVLTFALVPSKFQVALGIPTREIYMDPSSILYFYVGVSGWF